MQTLPSRFTSAVTVGVSAFAGSMSILVSLLGFVAVARAGGQPEVLARVGMTSESAIQLGLAVGFLNLANAYVAFRYARFRPFISAGVLGVLFVSMLVVNVLFVG